MPFIYGVELCPIEICNKMPESNFSNLHRIDSLVQSERKLNKLVLKYYCVRPQFLQVLASYTTKQHSKP